MVVKKETQLVRLLHGKSKSLTLNHKHLSSLPESTCLLHTLVNLDAKGNQLTDLPRSFGLLSSLENLNLGNNRFEHIPEQVGSLVSLRKLQIFSNPLRDITGVCSPSLRQLSILNFNNSQLSVLPPEINCLKASLSVLSLSGNMLVTLPNELCDLKALTELIADKNRLQFLPFNIARLANLRRLHVPQNELCELPESLSKLKRLRVLDVAGNQLRVFPTDMNTMELKELYCENNPLLQPNLVNSIQEEEILSLKEMCARQVMRSLRDFNSQTRMQISLFPGARKLLSQASKCAICGHSFLNTWLECVRFLSTESDLQVSKCTSKVVPQRVLLCSYVCFNSTGHDFYGVAFQ